MSIFSHLLRLVVAGQLFYHMLQTKVAHTFFSILLKKVAQFFPFAYEKKNICTSSIHQINACSQHLERIEHFCPRKKAHCYCVVGSSQRKLPLCESNYSYECSIKHHRQHLYFKQKKSGMFQHFMLLYLKKLPP